MNIKWVKIHEVIPYENNAKLHSEEQVAALAEQIKLEWDQPIVVDEKMVILKGHARRLAALALGLEEVPVYVRQDLDEEQKKAIRIADNKVAEAPWDPQLLKLELSTIKINAPQVLPLTGFTPVHIESIITPPTSEAVFNENARKSVKERFDQYQNSGLRQVILVMPPEQFENLMRRFVLAQAQFGVETNVEVVEKLFEFYEKNRDQSPESAERPVPQESA